MGKQNETFSDFSKLDTKVIFEFHHNIPSSMFSNGLPLANTMFPPACLKASAAVHSAVTRKLFRADCSNVTLFCIDTKNHKPFKVGFDIAKMAGLHESDSRIALRTFDVETSEPYK